MEKFHFNEGMFLKDIMNNAALKKLWIFDFKNIIARGVEIEGVKIWFPKKFRSSIDQLQYKMLGSMRLKSMDTVEHQFFLIPDLSLIQEGLFLEEIFERNEFEINFMKGEDNSLIQGINISNLKIWFPKNYRTTKSDLDMVALKKMKLKKMIMYNNEEAFFLIE